MENGACAAGWGVSPSSGRSKCACHWATPCSHFCPWLCSLSDSSSERLSGGWITSPWTSWWPGWSAACSTRSRPGSRRGGAAASGKGGWKATGRREEEEEDTGGGGGAGMNGGSGNAAASAAAAGGGRFDASTATKAGGKARRAHGTADAAADGDSATGEAGGGSATGEAGDGSAKGGAGGGSANAAGDLAAGAERAGRWKDSETAALCGSSSGREKEADVLGNGSHVWASGSGASASAAATVAAGDWPSGFAANSGYAWSESGPSRTWPSLCQICLWRSRCWVSLGCNRTRGRGNRWSSRQTRIKVSPGSFFVCLLIALATLST